MKKKIRIATRKSALALAQTRMIARELAELWPGLEVEEVHLVTQGDRILDVPLARVGGKGLFVSEVEAAVSDGRADLAVHSMKDVPAVLAEGLVLACIPKREDARDVLVSKSGEELDALEAGTKIGTSSLRRIALLRMQRNDLAYATLRGNIDTRLRKLDEGQYGAIVLAYAGLKRLGLDQRPLWPIPIALSLPAVGQGALALEARADDKEMLAMLAPLEHEPTRLAVEAERAFLAKLEGGCQVPIAGHAQIVEDDARLRFDGLVAAEDEERTLSAGSEIYVAGGGKRDLAKRIAEARAVGEEVAAQLIAQGAKGIVDAAREKAAREEREKARTRN